MFAILPRIRPVISKSQVFTIPNEISESVLEDQQAREISGQLISLIITEVAIRQGCRDAAISAIVTRFACDERVAKKVIDKLYPVK